VNAPPAFRQQLLSAIPRLRRYARSLVMDAAHADDLVQTALERALVHWQQFEPQRDIVVWLISIAHNAHMDELRRNARISVLDPDALADAQDAQQQQRAREACHGGGGGGGDPAHHTGLRLDLINALQRLPLEQREPLLLVCVEQLSYAECAEVLHIPVGTVMSRLSRGRAALRAWLDGGSTAGGLPPAVPAAPSARQLKRVV
jgi:RNA polymerase sigma-70 factor (ECF subfamily)